jgi:hypothetical protein
MPFCGVGVRLLLELLEGVGLLLTQDHCWWKVRRRREATSVVPWLADCSAGQQPVQVSVSFQVVSRSETRVVFGFKFP